MTEMRIRVWELEREDEVVILEMGTRKILAQNCDGRFVRMFAGSQYGYLEVNSRSYTHFKSRVQDA